MLERSLFSTMHVFAENCRRGWVFVGFLKSVFAFPFCSLCFCVSVVLWYWIGDGGFNPSLCAVQCDLLQVVDTRLPLSPSSIMWYCSVKWGVNRRTMHHTVPLSYLQLWLVSGWGSRNLKLVDSAAVRILWTFTFTISSLWTRCMVFPCSGAKPEVGKVSFGVNTGGGEHLISGNYFLRHCLIFLRLAFCEHLI